MTRRRIILLLLVLLLAAGTVTYLCLPKEPRYQGRTLSSWLRPLISPGFANFALDSAEFGTDYDNARTAVQAIGTNAIPWLIKWNRTPDSRTKEAFTRWANAHLPARLYLWPTTARRFSAEVGFRLLGETAKPACPIFVQWTFDKNEQCRALGLRCLISANADDAIMLPLYRRMINDENPYVREEAAYEYFRHFRKQAVADGLYEKFPQLHLQNVLTIDRATNQPAAK